MLLTVDRRVSNGQVQLALFAPVDLSGGNFTALVGWPGHPGGDWWFGFYLVDAAGFVWHSPRVRSPGPADAADGNTSRVAFQIGPVQLPPAWSNAFDARQTMQVWFECWLAPATPAQLFTVSVDSVTVGAATGSAWSIDPNQLPPMQTATLFGGYVSAVAMSDRGALDGSVDVTYSCRGYRVFTDGRNWNKDYTGLGMTDDAIIRDMLAGTGLTSILTYGSIQSTGILQLNFQYQSVTQCLNAISDATGLVWSIDPSGVFSYVQPAAQPVVIVLTDQPGGAAFRVDNYSEDFYAPANDITFIGDGVTAHVYDQASINQYGLLQWTDYDLRVTHANTALVAAQTDLQKASTPNERAQLTCWTVGAKPGNVVSATAARYGWTNKQLVVQRVEMTALAGPAALTQCVLTVGDYNPTLADAIQQIAKEVTATSAGGL